MQTAVANQHISEIIGLIYDSAGQPGLWPEILRILEQFTVEQPDEHALMHVLRPHFQRALELNKHIYALQSNLDAIESLHHRLPIGRMVVNSDMQVLAINHHAAHYVQQNNSLKLCRGTLLTPEPPLTRKLHTMIASVIDSHYDVRGQQLSQMFHVTGQHHHSCSLHLSPIMYHADGEEIFAASISVVTSDIRQCAMTQTLIDSYQLTMAEARLVSNMLNHNHSLAEAAESLQLSLHTVRSQMKQVFSKTDTHSQSELIQLLFAGPEMRIGADDQMIPLTPAMAEGCDTEDGNDPDETFSFHVLPDGALLEYREYGDPNGVPLIFLHGILHSRKCFHPSSCFVQEHGIRVIVPERPGFGASTPLAEPSVMRVAEAVADLANVLDLKAFYVLGDGMGAASALACASLMGDRVVRCAIVACMPGAQFDYTGNMMPFDRKFLQLAKSTPRSLLQPFSRMVLKAFKRDNSYFESITHDLSKADRTIIESPAHRSIFHESMENITDDTMDAFIADYFSRLYRWDFSLKHVRCPVDVWHGMLDRFGDLRSAEMIAAELPRCREHYLEHHGHYIFISHLDDILTRLFEGEPKQAS